MKMTIHDICNALDVSNCSKYTAMEALLVCVKLQDKRGVISIDDSLKTALEAKHMFPCIFMDIVKWGNRIYPQK